MKTAINFYFFVVFSKKLEFNGGVGSLCPLWLKKEGEGDEN